MLLFTYKSKEQLADEEAHKNDIKVKKAKVGEHELVVKPHFETNLKRRIQIALPSSGLSVSDFEIGLGFTKNISYF
ncbi:hypothetical protein [Succinivibrio dextrinosolvens]|uniref:hypothetical protein n=1 Tax=Succinivibrio dextrinosolvens TaxID=83771 RepID=UPI0019212F32|nr:hypothetical protein [Succinivibrio dextrinosolvens]